MTLPILIGSKAALINGYLPFWRNGSTNDTDIICSLEYRDALIAEQQPSTHLVATSCRGVMFDHPKGIHLNYEVMPDDVVERIAALCSQTTSLFPDHEALVAPLEVVWASRVYTVGYSERSLEKAVKDAVFYDALPKNLTDELLAIADIIRKRGLVNLMEQLNKPE